MKAHLLFLLLIASPAFGAVAGELSGLSANEHTISTVPGPTLLQVNSPDQGPILVIHRAKSDGRWVVEVPKGVRLEGAAAQFIKALGLRLNEGCDKARP